MKKLVVGIVAVTALLIGLWVVVERLMSAGPRRVEGFTVTLPAPPRVEQPAGDAPPAADAASAMSVSGPGSRHGKVTWSEWLRTHPAE